MGGVGDMIAELTNDHREVEELFTQLEKVPPGRTERKRLVDALTIELVRHSVAEEQYLHPAMREHLTGGDTLADKELADHFRIEKLLDDLQKHKVDDLDFDRLVVKLRTEVAAHISEEENDLFAQLRTGVRPYVLEELGKKVRQAKKTAPTRPHPNAPSTPPVNKLLAPGRGLVDRVRDYVSGRGR
ncbi:hemerythrin domain-containing protein [Streptomyces kronopolitis]